MKKLMMTAGGASVIVIAAICINIISSRLHVRADVTQDKIFSLSAGSKKILQGLNDEVTVKLYFSRSLRGLPPPVKTYATRVEEMLHAYANEAHGNLHLQVIDPKPDTDDEEWARKYGVQGVRMQSGDELFFGVVLLFADKATVIPYLDPRREEQLEYDLSQALVSVRRKEKAKLGIVSWLPVDGSSQGGMQENPQNGPWAFVSELRKANDVQLLDSAVTEIPGDIKVLFVMHPKNPSDSFQYAVDQFLMKGGRLIVAVDPFSRTDLALAGRASMGQMPQTSSDLPKLFAAWGVDYKADLLVGDLNHPTQINAGGVASNYPMFMSLGDESFAKMPITGALHQMLIAEGGELSKSAGSTYDFEPLISTSTESGTVSSTTASFQGPQDIARDLKSDGKPKVLAALVRGAFKSAFVARPPGSDGKQVTDGPAHKAAADGEGSILIVADTDFLFDQNAVDRMQFLNQILLRPRNDNLSFIYNAFDLLGGSDELLEVRSKGRISRPFTRLVAIEKNAQARWQEEEEKLNGRLADLQRKLNSLQAERTDGSRLTMTAEQQQEVERFRSEEMELRKRLRLVRRSLREDVESLGKKLTVANMTVIPLSLSGLGVGVFATRARRRKGGKAHA